MRQFLHFQRFIPYTVNFLVHTWNTKDCEGESPKNPGYIFCSILMILV